jgi:hypothetical protein
LIPPPVISFSCSTIKYHPAESAGRSFICENIYK